MNFKAPYLINKKDGTIHATSAKVDGNYQTTGEGTSISDTMSKTHPGTPGGIGTGIWNSGQVNAWHNGDLDALQRGNDNASLSKM